MTRKAPAFRFYSDDFLAGTFAMSNEQVGLYIRLLCLEWSQGSIDAETARQLAGDMADDKLAGVLAKFDDTGAGRLTNARLEFERRKQAEFRELCSAAGRRSGQRRLNEPSTDLEGTSKVPQRYLEGTLNEPSTDAQQSEVAPATGTDVTGKPTDAKLDSDPKISSKNPRSVEGTLNQPSTDLEGTFNVPSTNLQRNTQRNTQRKPNLPFPYPILYKHTHITRARAREDQPVEQSLPNGFPTTEAEAKAAAASVGCPEPFSADQWNLAMARNGKDAKGNPIHRWPHYLAAMWAFAKSRSEEQRTQQNANNRKAHQHADRSLGTANEGVAHLYRTTNVRRQTK